MFDVGAHQGSSLEPFARSGWSVHAFEPDPSNRIILQRAVQRWPDVRVVPSAVADERGTLPLYTSAESSGISSLVPFHASHKALGEVPVITLADYAAEQQIGSIDFLKIDVEGYEREVLAGLDWIRRPTAIVAEFEDEKTVPRGYCWRDLATTLAGKGYRVLVSEWFPIEAYGSSHRWRRFEEFPSQLADPMAWGNLIAVDETMWPALRRACHIAALKHQVGRGRPLRRAE